MVDWIWKCRLWGGMGGLSALPFSFALALAFASMVLVDPKMWRGCRDIQKDHLRSENIVPAGDAFPSRGKEILHIYFHTLQEKGISIEKDLVLRVCRESLHLCTG